MENAGLTATIKGSAGEQWIIKQLVRAVKVALVLFLLWVPLSFALSSFLVVDKQFEKPAAIVVLGGSAEYVEPTFLAASLFHQGLADKIILTNDGKRGGWNTEEQRNPYFVERARASLIDRGVPPEALVILPDVTDGTADEAAVVLRFAEASNLTSLQLVTSSYHSRRALWIFDTHRDRSRIRCSIGVTSSRGGTLDPSSYIWWLSLEGWRLVVSEYTKMGYYAAAK